jgi:hypothetical protein
VTPEVLLLTCAIRPDVAACFGLPTSRSVGLLDDSEAPQLVNSVLLPYKIYLFHSESSLRMMIALIFSFPFWSFLYLFQLLACPCIRSE